MLARLAPGHAQGPRRPARVLALLALSSGPALTVGLSAGLPACRSEQAAAPKPCCDQPEIPAGVTPFKVVAEEATGPSDGQKVTIRVGLLQPVKRDGVYPVLHTVYRHAMKRGSFEPIQIVADVYPSEAEARAGGDVKAIARISRDQTQLGPRCDNRVPYDFAEQARRAWGSLFGRAPEENLDDTCRLNPPKKAERFDEKFAHKPSYELDTAAQVITVTYPYLEMGKDEYIKDLKFNSAMTYWIDTVTSLFRKVPDLKEIKFAGVHNDAEVLKIAITRQQFESELSSLQETIAAHAAVTFQSLGLGRASDKGAEKEQETYKSKTYKNALAALPKSQVSISSKLK
jgi:hypothetical protein